MYDVLIFMLFYFKPYSKDCCEQCCCGKKNEKNITEKLDFVGGKDEYKNIEILLKNKDIECKSKKNKKEISKKDIHKQNDISGELDNIDNTETRFQEKKRCIEYYFGDEFLKDIGDEDLKAFLFHYEEDTDIMLNQKLHYILIKFLKTEIKNEALLKFLKYVFNYGKTKKIKTNNNFVLTRNNGKYELSVKSTTNFSGESNSQKNNDIDTIMRDIPRTIYYKLYLTNTFGKKYTDEIEEKIKNKFGLVLVSSVNDLKLEYAQGENVIAKFLTVLTLNEKNISDYDIDFVYNLYYHFVTYKFKNTIFKNLHIYKKGISLNNIISCMATGGLVEPCKNSTKNIVNNIGNVKVSSDKVLNDIINGYVMQFLLTYATDIITDFTVLKSVIFLLFFLNNHSLLLDLILLFLRNTNIKDIFENNNNNIKNYFNKFSMQLT